MLELGATKMFATATYLLEKGVPKDIIQRRGRWNSQANLDKHSPTLHNTQNWTGFF